MTHRIGIVLFATHTLCSLRAQTRGSTNGVYHLQFDYGCAPEAEYCLAQRNRSLSEISSISYIIQYNTSVLYVRGQEVNKAE